MQCERVRLYFDHIFIKEPVTPTGTPFHQDLPYWPFRGHQICTVWVTLDDVDAASSGLEFVKGSHRWGKFFRPTRLGQTADWIGSSDEDQMPDFATKRADDEFVGFDIRAGDALIFSSHIVHGSTENRSPSHRRLAVATRWLGDDAIWDPRTGTDPIVGADDVQIRPGDPPHDDQKFPVVWSRR